MTDWPPAPLDRAALKAALSAHGYRTVFAAFGLVDVHEGGRVHLLSAEEAQALAVSAGPHPLDLMAHSEPMSSLNRRYTFPGPALTGARPD